MTSFSLYPFQEEDIAKIEPQKAGLIGSEMGTGKTHEGIALDEAWWKRGAKPTLIVAPLNTFDVWREKYGQQSPKTDVTVIDRKNRDVFVQAIRRRRGDVFLMHWDALRLMPELSRLEFNTVIADEVHRAANRKAQATRALKKLNTTYKLGLSGTASGDKPENLWSILNWLWPSFYRSYWKFFNHYLEVEYDEFRGYRKVIGVKNVDSLKKQMSPWYVRHLKKEQCCDHHPEGVMSWLKDKTYDNIWVDLTPTQRKIYDQMRKQMVAWVDKQEQDSPLTASVVVAQMARLSQMALATPELYDKKVRKRFKLEDGTTELRDKYQVTLPDGSKEWRPYIVEAVRLKEPSAKLDRVQELIQDHPEKQFVIASSSRQICYIAQEKFKRSGISSFVLSGDTPQKERDGMVQRFVNGDTQLFIGVIEAMGEGIDGLQHATDTMIFLDRSWKTVKNKQCEDRLHRGGQKESVQIIDIMAKNTLDWGRRTKLETKWTWIKTILGDMDNTAQKILTSSGDDNAVEQALEDALGPIHLLKG